MIKTLIRVIAFVILALLLGILWASTAKSAAAPEIKTENYISEDIKIENNAIIKPAVPIQNPNRIRLSHNQNLGSSTSVFSGRHYTKEEVQQLIRDYSAQYGISPTLPLAIAYCESGYNQFAKNKTSTAAGVFQYLSSTWRNTSSGKQGISVFDADANIRMAISSIAANGTSPWNASKSCWPN